MSEVDVVGLVTTLTDARPFRMGDMSAPEVLQALRDRGVKIVAVQPDDKIVVEKAEDAMMIPLRREHVMV